MELATIEDAILDIQKGRMVIVIDDENRENEGDFIMAAEHITPTAINFMAKYGRGLICTPITKKRAKQLDLPLMVENNNTPNYTAFTVSIDARIGGTGISTSDRALTTKLLSIETTLPFDFYRPGHIFPLIAHDGGVLKRAGHTEAAVDLAKLASCHPTGVICEILNDDGTMARVKDLEILAKKFQLKMISIEDLITYRKKEEIKSISITKTGITTEEECQK